ncbi:LYST-interacting protein 5-like protein [Zea mays]|uniref:LYST-interacting protein 5-like protein n=1 Tax=Zea mays TaxID=4577 RepID=A0A1D6LXR8_MAIZE|nr:LYST-interacting protein 5-like protein [Zea mays]
MLDKFNVFRFISPNMFYPQDKKSLTLGPDDNLHLEGFALNVFVKADKQDRAGRADINTAKTFYAASIFFEILNQFGELQPDIEQKQKYAIWKAAEIRKALKEGRKPEAGPPGGDKDEAPVSTTTISQDFSRRDSFSAVQPGNNVPHQSTEFNDHPSTQLPYSPPPPSQSQHPSPSQSYSSPSYQATTDYPSSDFHKPSPNYSTPGYTSTDFPTNEVHNHLPIIPHLLTQGQIALPMTATILTAMVNQMFRLTLRHINPHPTHLTLSTTLKTTTPRKPQLFHTTTLIPVIS